MRRKWENEKQRLLKAITDIHEVDLVYAGAIVVMEMLRVKNRKRTRMEPW